MKAYVVRGETGAYSSFRIWEVRAFNDQARADMLCKELNAWCLANICHTSQEGQLYNAGNFAPESCPLDPHFEGDDIYGTKYSVWDIEVEC